MTLPIQQPGDGYDYGWQPPEYLTARLKSYLAAEAKLLAREDLEYKDRVATFQEGQLAELVAFVSTQITINIFCSIPMANLSS